MLQIIIKWKYYKEKSIFNLDKARRKKESVFFVDYDKYTGHIIQNMEYSDLQKLRLNIFNQCYKLLKYVPFKETDKDWNIFEWYDITSPVIDIDSSDFAKLIPSASYRKLYYVRDSFREKYFLKSNFINYINLNVI